MFVIRACIHAVIHRLLQILTLQPVSTASAERSLSCLRRLKKGERNTISDERLSGLASMVINQNRMRPEDVKEIPNKFAKKK